CLQAANAGDRQTLLALWADDIIWHVKGTSPWQGEIKGPEDILEYLADLGEVGSTGFNTEVEDVMVSNRRAAALCHSSAERGDRALDTSFLFITTIVDRRIQEVITVPIDPDRVEKFWAE
ncbi:MAG: nuclear transport factor 2 family protein, partial [Phycisphaeraceae bacterium]|nr:nuclear transport factor 2 family protein [Phycisphaeraceae bacterium]